MGVLAKRSITLGELYVPSRHRRASKRLMEKNNKKTAGRILRYSKFQLFCQEVQRNYTIYNYTTRENACFSRKLQVVSKKRTQFKKLKKTRCICHPREYIYISRT